MPYCTFRIKGEPAGRNRVGFATEREVLELTDAVDALEFLRLSETSRPDVGKRAHEHKNVILSAPVPRPGKIVAAIVNTSGMLGGPDVTLERPRLDMKAPSTVTGPGERILAPPEGIRPEVELAVVIGEETSAVTPVEARKAIFGYTILDDVTAPNDSKEDAYEAYRRDKTTGTIKKTVLRGPLFRSKNHDTFCPMGPWIAVAKEIGDATKLRMTTKFRGKLIQSGSTSEYLFKPWEIVSYISGFLTLEPGDIVSCGSVGWENEALGGLDPTEFKLPKGEGKLELEIERIGRLVNPVVPN